MFLQNDIIISIKCPKIDQKIYTLNPQLHTIRGQPWFFVIKTEQNIVAAKSA